MTEEDIKKRSQLYTAYSVKDKQGKYRSVIDVDTVKVLIDEQVKKALDDVEKEMHKISVKYCLPISLKETQEVINKLRKDDKK